MHNFSFGEFCWFIGVVEDREDPNKLGRVKVRVFGYHSQDTSEVTKEDLPWATVMLPTNSASKKGIGQAPVGMQVGTHVVGFFLDSENAQVPMIMGTLVGMPDEEPDTNKLVRGEQLDETIIQDKIDNLLTSDPNGSSMSASSLTQQLTDATKLMDTNVLSARSLTGSLQIPSLSDIQANMGSILANASGPITAEGALAQIQNTIGNIQGQVATIQQTTERLKSITNSADQFDVQNILHSQIDGFKQSVEGAASGILGPFTQQIGNLTSAVDALQNLKSATLSFNSLQQALSSVSQLLGAIGQLKALSRFLGGSAAATINGLKAGALSNVWNEAPSRAAPKYPYNDIKATEGGHVDEFDNTPGSERRAWYHPTGTFQEVAPDGTIVTKIVKDNYSITMGDHKVHVEGEVQVNILGNAKVVVAGDLALRVDGNRTDIVSGDYTLAVAGDYSLAIDGACNIKSNTHFKVLAPRVDLNE
jgi:hypothetical protein